MAALEDEIVEDLRGITSWLAASKLALYVLKTGVVVIGSRQRLALLTGNGALRDS